MKLALFNFKVSYWRACVCGFALFSSPSMAVESAYDSGLVHFVQGHYQLALKNFYTAAKRGEAGAAHMLMRMHAEGRGTPVDKQKAFRWTLVAAQEGMASAQYQAAKMYLESSAANANEQAVYWFTKAVNQGHIAAHYALAQMYENGLGVSVDQERAQALYLYAASELDVFAQKGDPKAQTRLAGMYEKGLGVPTNIGLALKWMKRAAINDYAQAQFHLARLIASLDDDQSKPEEALYWVDRAVSQGYQQALVLRNELEHRWPEFARR